MVRLELPNYFEGFLSVEFFFERLSKRDIVKIMSLL